MTKSMLWLGQHVLTCCAELRRETFMDTRWPTLLEPSPLKGTIRTSPEDFTVEEIPAYLPCGSGGHLMIEIEKRSRTTDEVIQALARHLNIRPTEIGSAGMKDRHAITRQWFSVPATAGALLESFNIDGVAILRSGLHTNKLKTGHLKGNRFTIRVRGLSGNDVDQLQTRVDLLARRGAPNYFGTQRFGVDQRNEDTGCALLRGEKLHLKPRILRLMLSAVQSAMFNDVLALRIKSNLFEQVLPGDVLVKADSGGIFICDDPVTDQQRFDAREVHISGPMFGPKMKAATGAPGNIEAQVLAAHSIDPEAFRRFAKLTMGTRRPLRLAPLNLNLEREADAVRLQFSLPPGGYATTVLRELIEVADAASADAHKREEQSSGTD
jgi:tRNA pseudouridine13 synthase